MSLSVSNLVRVAARATTTKSALVKTTAVRSLSSNSSIPVLLLDGDGVGAEITSSARHVVDAVSSTGACPNIDWVEMAGYGYDNNKPGVTEDHLDTFDELGLLLKGPITIPGGGKGNVTMRDTAFTSANQAMRRLFGLYANVRPAYNFKLPWPTRYGDVNIDMVIIRENTEDLYCGKPEVWVDDDTCEATKRITRQASARISQYAAKLALDRQAQRGSPCTITAVHKSNVCKETDGMFLEEARKAVTAAGGGLIFKDALVDSLCAGMVIDPEAYDVLVAPNCWGDIISDLAGGLVGSLGLLGSANIGDNHALFEASHGSAPDIQGQGIVNPTSMILSASMMLRHSGHPSAAAAIDQALRDTLASGCATTDLGGSASTDEFTQAVIAAIKS